jgi:hypothetical protein
LTNPSQTFAEAVKELAGDAAIRAELMVASDRLQQKLAPCGKEAIIAELSPMLAVYGVGEKSEREWATFWKLYIQALGDLPLEALRGGVAEYTTRADSEFFPKPGPLRAICERYAVPLRMAASRAKRALEQRT